MEINVKELRIGNLVFDKEDGNYYKIPSGASIDNSHLMEPIPLTEEILLKCGFEKRAIHCFYLKYNQIDLYLFSWETPVGQSNGVPAPAFYILINGVIIILEHLHQLQNLYFALTGQELNVDSLK